MRVRFSTMLVLSIASASCGSSTTEVPIGKARSGSDGSPDDTFDSTMALDSAVADTLATVDGSSPPDTTSKSDATLVTDTPADAFVEGEFGGVFQNGFETSAFYKGGPCSWSSTAWWLNAADPKFYEEVAKVGGSMVYVRFEGRLTPEGMYGHLGGYPREITVTKTLFVTALPPC